MLHQNLRLRVLGGNFLLNDSKPKLLQWERNADHASVFRTELIAIICGLSFINNIRDLSDSEIWILTDSRSSIQHLSNWPSIGDSTIRSILPLFQQLSERHSIHLQWAPSHVGLLGNEVADVLAKAATSNPVDPENHMILTSTEIYSRAKELICRAWVVPPVHPCQRYTFNFICRLKLETSKATRQLKNKLKSQGVKSGEYTMPWISKNTSSMTFSLERTWRNFRFRGDCGDFYVTGSFFDCRLDRKHHFLSPETTMPYSEESM
ncbi:RNase H domain-containing protein [Trichonephila clavipes]|nr:RNase H domain-containing protein [Trichonephila clavipes]